MPKKTKSSTPQPSGFASVTPKDFAFRPEETRKLLENLVHEKRRAVFQRFPLLFTFLAAFGFVATFYGFEGLMDRIGLSSNPLLLLAVGVGILLFTGTLYKKLGD